MDQTSLFLGELTVSVSLAQYDADPIWGG